MIIMVFLYKELHIRQYYNNVNLVFMLLPKVYTFGYFSLIRGEFFYGTSCDIRQAGQNELFPYR
jgi:hypothetical protein